MNSFWLWNFWNEIKSILITCVPNFKVKKFTQKKILEICQCVSLWETILLIPLWHPPESWKFLILPKKIVMESSQKFVNVCVKFQGQKIYREKNIVILPSCRVVRKVLLLPTLTPFKGSKIVLWPLKFWHRIISNLIICMPNSTSKGSHRKIYSNSTNMHSCESDFLHPCETLLMKMTLRTLRDEKIILITTHVGRIRISFCALIF